MTFTGADLIAAGLAHYGVRHVFGIVSIHNMPIFDAINRLGKTRIIDVRHELAGAHAADGYARATGDLGVVIASTGPGASNTVTGLYEAGIASSRVLLITGQAETAFYGKGLSYVHEAENQVPMLQSVCRRVESPRHASQLESALANVVEDLFVGRGAPGALEIPIDLQYAPVAQPSFALLEPPRFAPDAEAVRDAASRLKKAEKRVLIYGGGVVAADASSLATRLAEALDCPVLTSSDGRGAVPEDHTLCVGNFFVHPKVHAGIADADVTLAIGTRFAVGVEGQQAKLAPPGELIHVDVDPSIIGRTHTAALGIHSDAGLFIEALLEELTGELASDRQWGQGVLEAGAAARAAGRKRLGDDWPYVMDHIRDLMPRDANFVRDQTISAYNWGNQLFPIYEPRSTMNPGSGAIGPGFPLALGAAIATAKKTVVIHGDGGFLYHATELATAAQYDVPLVVCVFNDQGYGVLRWLQDTRFGRINETDLGKVDFAMMAQSMGVPGQRVTSVEEFGAAFRTAMAAQGPYLIDVDMEHFAPMAISMMPKKPVSDSDN